MILKCKFELLWKLSFSDYCLAQGICNLDRVNSFENLFKCLMFLSVITIADSNHPFVEE
jgi:hypothetical protein